MECYVYMLEASKVGDAKSVDSHDLDLKNKHINTDCCIELDTRITTYTSIYAKEHTGGFRLTHQVL